MYVSGNWSFSLSYVLSHPLACLQGHTFFDDWSFSNEDANWGAAQYVDRTTATAEGLIEAQAAPTLAHPHSYSIPSPTTAPASWRLMCATSK